MLLIKKANVSVTMPILQNILLTSRKYRILLSQQPLSSVRSISLSDLFECP